MDSMAKKLVKGKMGSIMLDPNTADECWHAYNLIAQGDSISAKTFRKVKIGNHVTQVHVQLEIEVETITLNSTRSSIRIHGKNLTKNEHVRIGAYHSIEVGTSTPFKVSKTVWDERALHQLQQFYNGKNPLIVKHANNKSQSKDQQAFQDWLDMWEKDTNRAIYGSKEVYFAHENLAIKTLLLTESQFKNANVDIRKKFVALVDAVKANGGKVHIFPTTHVSNKLLEQHTGVVAILRFPMPGINELDYN
jgi:stalled ribosome rescue protein Dom34